MKGFCWPCGFCLMAIVANAQPGINEMQQARQDLSSDFYAMVDLAFVIAFIFGLIGALKIYKQIQDGNRDITPNISAWFYAAMFMLLSGLFLKALFGI
jgi:hypothetical protein